MNPQQPIILTLDGRPPAILDKDLAMKFQVKTTALNQARARNPKRFPKDFAFRLSDEEIKMITSQNATLPEAVANWFTHNPWAYTEEGVAMMAGCLKTDVAAQTSVELMRMFRDVRGFIKSQQQSLELISKHLLQSKPLWQAIKRYKSLGLNHAEIAKLTQRAGSTVRKHVRDMERCGLLVPPKALAAMQQQQALNFSGNVARIGG